MSNTNLKQVAVCECGGILDEAFNGEPSYKLINGNPTVMQDFTCLNCNKTRFWDIKTYTLDNGIELIKGHRYWILLHNTELYIGQFNGMHKFAQEHSWYLLGRMGGEHTGDLMLHSGSIKVLMEIDLPVKIFKSLPEEVQKIEKHKQEKYLNMRPIIPYQKIITGERL